MSKTSVFAGIKGCPGYHVLSTMVLFFFFFLKTLHTRSLPKPALGRLVTLVGPNTGKLSPATVTPGSLLTPPGSLLLNLMLPSTLWLIPSFSPSPPPRVASLEQMNYSGTKGWLLYFFLGFLWGVFWFLVGVVFSVAEYV